MSNTVDGNVNIRVSADVSNAGQQLNKLKTYFMDVDGYIRKINDIKIDNGIDAQVNNIRQQLNKLKTYIIDADGYIRQINENDIKLNTGASAPDDMIKESIDRLQSRAEQADESTNKFKETFNEMINTLSQSGGSIGGIANVIKSFGDDASSTSAKMAILGVEIAIAKKIWSEFNKIVDESLETFKNFGLNIAESVKNVFVTLATDGFDAARDALKNLVDAMKSAVDTMKEFAETGAELNTALFVMNNYLGSDGAGSLQNYIDRLGELKGIDITDTTKSLKGLFGSLSNMDLNTDEMEKYSKAFIGFMNDLSVYQDTSVNDIAGQLEAAVSFGVLNSRSALAKSIDITDEMIDSFKELGSTEERAQWILARWPIFAGKYDEWLETDQGKVTVLKNTWTNLMDTVGQMALKVYAIVAPMLTQLLNLANSVLSGIMKLFNVDADASTSTASAGYNNLADSISKVGDAAKKSSKQTASFDDVIQISDSGADTSQNVAGLYNMSDMLAKIGEQLDENETLWEKWSKKINEDIARGDLFSAGKNFGQFLYEWMNQIDWNNINSKVSSFAKNIAQAFNDLNSNKGMWLMAGQTIGNGINTITLGIKTFFENFDGAEFGDSLGFMWKNMWDTFDEQQAADALYEVFNDVFEIVGGFLEHGGFMSMAESITKTITGFFSDIAENGNASEYAQTLYDLAKNIFLSFANAIYTVVTDENTKSTVKEAIGTLFSNIADDADDLAVDLVTLVTSIIEFIGEAIVTPENVDNIVSAIKTFINTIVANKDKIVEALKPIIETITQALKELNDSGEIGKMFDTIYEICSESGIFDLIGEWMTTQTQILFMKVWFKTKAKVETIFNNLKDAVERGWNISVLGKLTDLISKIWPSIKSGLTIIWNNFKGWWNEHFGGKNLIDITIPDWIPGVGGKSWNFNIPKLATGGIVTKSTIANIGEAGAEAVVPLENNTGWMDKFASKIASKLNNTQNNQNITISINDISSGYMTRSDKIKFAEQIVGALKIYGVNVAVV